MALHSYPGNLTPAGILRIASWWLCCLPLYTQHKYEPPASEFKDFAELCKQHLSKCQPGHSHDSNVIIEGTVAKLAESSIHSEKAGIEGAAHQVLSSSQAGKISTVSDIFIPFLLIDLNGEWPQRRLLYAGGLILILVGAVALFFNFVRK